MSTGDFLFQGNPPTDFTNVTDTNAQMPQWWQDAAQGLIGQASAIAGQPYNPYPGPTVAGLDPLQTGAAEGSTQYGAGINSNFNNANNTIAGAGNIVNGVNPNAVASYMNPYTNGVIQSIQQLGKDNLVNNLLPAVNSTFTGAGQFGSSQHANFTQQALTNEEQTTGQQIANVLSGAQQNAFANALTGNQQAIAAGTAQGNLANTQGQEDRSQLEFQNLMGGQNQAQNQANLNSAQTAFNNQTNYPQQMAQFLNSIIHGFQPNNQSTTTSTTPLGNTGNFNSGSVTSGLTNISGALSGLFKEGGQVKRKRASRGALSSVKV